MKDMKYDTRYIRLVLTNKISVFALYFLHMK